MGQYIVKQKNMPPGTVSQKMQTMLNLLKQEIPHVRCLLRIYDYDLCHIRPDCGEVRCPANLAISVYFTLLPSVL